MVYIAIAFACVFWLCTCVPVCLHSHCNFICMCTCICVCICVDACIAFALQLFCICVCARIGQATKASCNGLRNDACQHIGSYWHAGLQTRAREQLLAPFPNHVRRFQEVATSGKSTRCVDIKVCFWRSPRLGYAFHTQPFWLGSHWYNIKISSKFSRPKKSGSFPKSPIFYLATLTIFWHIWEARFQKVSMEEPIPSLFHGNF